jgi:hypothetical protein
MTMERMTIQTNSGQSLTIAPGTEENASYSEILSFWQRIWDETKPLRPDYSVVEEFLIEKRMEVERENRN